MFVPTSGGYSPRIRDNIRNFSWYGRFVSEAFRGKREPLIVSFSDKVGVLLIFWMVKSVCLEKYREIF